MLAGRGGRDERGDRWIGDHRGPDCAGGLGGNGDGGGVAGGACGKAALLWQLAENAALRGSAPVKPISWRRPRLWVFYYSMIVMAFILFLLCCGCVVL